MDPTQMSAAATRARVLAATVLLKILTPHLAKYGITLQLDDVEDIVVAGALAWHEVAPIIERFLPPKASPAQPAKS